MPKILARRLSCGRPRWHLLVPALIAAVGLATIGPAIAWAAPTTIPSIPFSWNAPSGSFGLVPRQVPFPVQMVVSPTALGHGNGDAAVHEFSVSATGDLWDGFTSDINQSTLAFTVTNISAQAGSTVSTGTPVGALYLGGSNPSTQVFALSPAGHLLSFVALGDGAASGNSWQGFDLSAMSGSSAFLTTGPQPIQFGSTVHVYVTDSNKHLHDFYKTASGNWQDIDMTNQTGVHSIFGEPYAYGGNSIQTVTTSSGGDLLTVIQSVNPDGTLVRGFRGILLKPFVADLTQLSGGSEFPDGTPRPIVTSTSTVNIFVDDTNGNLVDFIKTPTGNWQVASIANVGEVNLTPAPIATSGNSFEVVTNDSAGNLIDYLSTGGSPFGSQTLIEPQASPAVGDPSMVAVGTGSTSTLAAFCNING